MSTVENARAWATELVHRETRGPGDLANAMRRVERQHRIPYSLLWSLRYRRPKDVVASVYLRLRSAVEAERQRQLRRLINDLATTKVRAGPDAPAVRAAEALVRQAEDALK